MVILPIQTTEIAVREVERNQINSYKYLSNHLLVNLCTQLGMCYQIPKTYRFNTKNYALDQMASRHSHPY